MISGEDCRVCVCVCSDDDDDDGDGDKLSVGFRIRLTPERKLCPVGKEPSKGCVGSVLKSEAPPNASSFRNHRCAVLNCRCLTRRNGLNIVDLRNRSSSSEDGD